MTFPNLCQASWLGATLRWGGFALATLILLWADAASAQITLSPSSLPNGTEGVAYSQNIVASGGAGPYTYAVTSGALPPGLALSAGGAITGTPTTSGVSNFTIRATDSTSATGSRAYSIAVGTFSLTLLPASLPAGTQGVAYNQTITAIGGTAPYTFSVSSGSLPPGLSLASSGALSGTPSAGGSYGFIVQAIDPDGNTGFRTYTVNIGGATLTVNPASLPNGSQGVAYNQTVTASGGTGPYTFTITSGSLPAGLSLSSGGVISGTPTGSGTSNFTIRALDSVGNIGSRAYAVSIGTASLTLSPSSLPNGTQGTAYSQTVSASGGTGPYTFAITSGSLPAGLSLDTNTGAITGTPTGSGSSAFTIRATDSVNNTGSRNYTINIGTNLLTVTPASLADGVQGTAYSQTINASGGTGPYTFAVISGSLPNGLSLSSGGALTGTPSAAGTFNFTVRATDSLNNTGSRAYSVDISLPALVINPSSLPVGTQGTPYSQTVTASGGTAPYSYAVVSGSLPPGLTLNAGSGTISGTPTTGGSYGFTIQATDATPNTGTRAYTLIIGTNSLTVSPATLPNGTQGTAYSQTVSASGGTGPYTFAVSAGALPAGLSLNASSGAITGTPTGSGPSSFTIAAADSVGNVGSRSYVVNIGTSSLTVDPSSLPNGTQGTAYSQTVSASGGTGPYTYSISSGALPAGISLNSNTGAITGTPTCGCVASFTIRATDTVGNVGSRSYTVSIGTNSLTVNPASLPNGTQGSAYSQIESVSGGTGPYTFVITSGALPAGVTLNASTGALTGTPTGSGPAIFTVQATDSAGNVGSRSYTVNIGTVSLTVAPASLPNGTQGTAYSQTVSASGGTGPYTFAVTAGALPAGLTLAGSTGLISGTPTAGGAASFTVQAIDALGNTGSRAYAFNIGTNSLTVNPASLPNGTQGVAYSQTVSASGGTGPYTFAISVGALPAGLSFNVTTGAISGTPTGSGSSSFTVRATDTLGNAGTRAYAVNIGTNSLSVNPATLPAAVIGRAYSQTVTASGGTAPYTYSIVAGALPAGLTLNAATGAISGTATVLGSASFTIQALDVNGNIGSRAYALVNRQDPAADPEVRGLINSQVAVARRFASTQIDNVARHLESLHDRFNACSVDFGVGLPNDPHRSPYYTPSELPPLYYNAPPNSPAMPSAMSPAAQVAHRMPASEECLRNGGFASSFSAWVGGAAQFGSVTPNGLTANNRFMTSGLTAGVDWRVNGSIIVGGAIGYGSDRTDVGAFGTRSEATSVNGVLYASVKPLELWFIDAAVGYGTLGYDNRRFVVNDGGFVAGNRSGSYWFGMVSTSIELRFAALRVAPYLRGDFLQAHLKGYSETGASPEALSYGALDVGSVSGAVGLRGSYDIPVNAGVVTPIARVEYRRVFEGSFEQSMYYSDLGPSLTSVMSQAEATRGMINANVGLRARSHGGISAEVEYGLSASSGSLLAQSIRAALRLPF